MCPETVDLRIYKLHCLQKVFVLSEDPQMKSKGSLKMGQRQDRDGLETVDFRSELKRVSFPRQLQVELC